MSFDTMHRSRSFESIRRLVASRKASSERGDVIVTTSIILMLLLLFIFVYELQISMIHASHVRSQRAMDFGASSGAMFMPGSAYAARAAAGEAEDVFLNKKISIGGRYSEYTLTGNDSLRIVLPRVGTSTSSIDVFDKTVVGASTLPSAAHSLSGQAAAVFFGDGNGRYAALDPAAPLGGGAFTSQIDDFNNAIFMYAKFSPWRTFSLTPFAPEVEIASAVYIRPMLLYLLVDTHFSMNDLAAESTFGRFQPGDGGWDPADHRDQWPIYRIDPDDSGNWTWPSDEDVYGQFRMYPQRGDLLLCCDGTDCLRCGTALDGTRYQDKVKYFFSSLCRSAPFYNILQASVGTLDILGRISSFSGSTAVGLVGPYSEPNDVKPIPIHPGTVSGSEWVHLPAANFPLPFRGGASPTNKYLFSPKQTAFHGWVHVQPSAIPAVSPDTDPPASPVSGHDLPQLCIGRAMETSTNAIASLASDIASFASESPEPSHADPGLRRRASSAVTWCSDDTSGGRDYSELSSGRDGINGGETARNLLAQQCMLVGPTEFYKVGGLTWNRPALTGIRTLPRRPGPSIVAAASYLRQAKAAYNNPSGGNPYAMLRQIDHGDVALIISLYAPFNDEAVAEYSAAHGGCDLDCARNFLITEFKEALAFAACGRKSSSTPPEDAEEPMMVILGLHPMTEEDRQAVVDVQGFLPDYAQYFEAQEKGSTPPATISGCGDDVKVRPVYYLVIDYQGVTSAFSDSEPEMKYRDQVLKASVRFMNAFPSAFLVPQLYRMGSAY